MASAPSLSSKEVEEEVVESESAYLLPTPITSSSSRKVFTYDAKKSDGGGGVGGDGSSAAASAGVGTKNIDEEIQRLGSVDKPLSSGGWFWSTNKNQKQRSDVKDRRKDDTNTSSSSRIFREQQKQQSADPTSLILLPTIPIRRSNSTMSMRSVSSYDTFAGFQDTGGSNIRTIRFQVVLWYVGAPDEVHGRVEMKFQVSIFWNSPHEDEEDVVTTTNVDDDVLLQLEDDNNCIDNDIVDINMDGSVPHPPPSIDGGGSVFSGDNGGGRSMYGHHNPYHKKVWKMHGRQRAYEAELKEVDKDGRIVYVPPVSILNAVDYECLGEPEVCQLNTEENLMKWSCMVC
jgi:hypothetical protein